MFNWDTLVNAVAMMLTWKGIALLSVGTIVGIIFGAIPGLSGVTALVVLIPMTYGMDPIMAMCLLGASYGASTYGGAVPAILINTPGEPQCAATVLDGFPLSQQGKAGFALGAAATASTLGGFFGILLAFLFIPILSSFVMAFSYAEFLMMTLFGLSMIAMLSEGTMIKGLVAGGAGILLSCVGYDPMTSELRYTLGFEFLWDGIQVVPALFGLLAVGEMMDLLIKESAISGLNQAKVPMSDVMSGVTRTLREWFLVLRCSFIGFVIGAVPGLGGTVAGFLSYIHAKQTSGNPDGFGKGDVRGVIAPESANDAKEGGSLLPTLAFGIPGSMGMAVFLGALTLHGIETGQAIFVKNLGVVYMLILAILGSHITGAIIGLSIADKMALLTKIRPVLFAPVLLMVCLIGSYALRNNMGDVFVTVLFGFIGYEMRKFGFPRVSLILGLLLGNLAELAFRQTLMTKQGAMAFITRPIAVTILLLTIGSLLWPYLQTYLKRRRQAD